MLGLIARAEDRDRGRGRGVHARARAGSARPRRRDQLGQLLLQERKYAEAIDLFQRAIDAEPYNATAAYGLATALTRGGAREDGAAAMAQFQTLRDSGYATTYSQNYLEQGRYAEAIVVDRRGAGAGRSRRCRSVTFTDATASILPEARKPGGAGGATEDVTLVDLDADGDLD